MVSATLEDGKLISSAISAEVLSGLVFRGSFSFSLGFIFGFCFNFLDGFGYGLGCGFSSPRSWPLYRDYHRRGNPGATPQAVKLRGQCRGTHQSSCSPSGNFSVLRRWCVGASREFESALSTVPDPYAPSLYALEHASGAFVFRTETRNYRYVPAPGNRSVSRAEAAGEACLAGH